MSAPQKRRPLVSRRGQLALYVLVVVLAILASLYAGGVYHAMSTDLERILNANGLPSESREHGEITAIVLMGVPAIAVPLAVVAVFALVGWGLCLLGLRTPLPGSSRTTRAVDPHCED